MMSRKQPGCHVTFGNGMCRHYTIESNAPLGDMPLRRQQHARQEWSFSTSTFHSNFGQASLSGKLNAVRRDLCITIDPTGSIHNVVN